MSDVDDLLDSTKLYQHGHEAHVTLKPLKQDDSALQAKRDEIKKLKMKQRLKKEQGIKGKAKSKFGNSHESTSVSRNQSVSKLELLKQKKIDAKLAKQRAEIKRLKDKRKSANLAKLSNGGSNTPSTKSKFGSAHENENIGHIKSAEQVRQAKVDAKLAKKRAEIKKLKMKKKLAKMKKNSLDSPVTPGTPHTPGSANSAHETSVTSKNQTVSKLELLKQKKIDAKLAKQRAEIKRLKDKRKSQNRSRTPSMSTKKYGNAHEDANIVKIKSAEQVRQAKIDAKLAKQREEIKRLKMKRKSQNKAKLTNSGSNTPTTKKKYGNAHESANVGKIKSQEQIKQAKIDAKLAKQRAEIKRLKQKRKRENELGIKPQAKVKFGSAHEQTTAGSKNNTVSKKERMKQNKIDKKLAAKRAEIKAMKERRRLENEYKNGNYSADVMDSDDYDDSSDETTSTDDEDAYAQVVSSADDRKVKPKKYDDALDDDDSDDNNNNNNIGNGDSTPAKTTSGSSSGSSVDDDDDDDDSLDSNASF